MNRRAIRMRREREMRRNEIRAAINILTLVWLSVWCWKAFLGALAAAAWVQV